MAEGYDNALTQGQMHANLTAAKEARKRSELDAQLLANRIALLRQEEEKAWKKIEETRKRASEIAELRTQNEEKFQAKEQFYKSKWESIRAEQAQNAYNREKSKVVREAAKQAIVDARKQNVQEAKEQSQMILIQKKEREAAERDANIERSNLIKQKKDDAKRKSEEDRLAQLEKFRENYEARTAQEALLQARTEALVQKMEKEEMELIQRLQNTQTVQRNAYDELETALGSTSRPGTANARLASGADKDAQNQPDMPRPAA